jgi:hypothetical protein
VLVTETVTLTRSSTILAFASSLIGRFDTTNFVTIQVTAQLLSGTTVVADRRGNDVILQPGAGVNTDSAANGPLLDAGTGAVYVAAPGTYTLQLSLDDGVDVGSTCGNQLHTSGDSVLSYQAMST